MFIVLLLVLVLGISGAVALARLKPTVGTIRGTVKESFTTTGACVCPPDSSDKPQTIDISSSEEYRKIKEKDRLAKQNCNPNVGCAQGHTIIYRHIE